MLKLRVLSLCLLGWSGLGLADVLPPDAYELHVRARENPAAYDRADAWCAGKSIGSACEVPGNAFEGGGKGLCRQIINRPSRSLDAVCKVTAQVAIDRKLPDSGFMVDSRLCELAQRDPSVAESLKREQAGCTPIPPVADQFCDRKKVGDACQVELNVDGIRASFAGKCSTESQESRFYHYGYNIKRRDVILCQPAKPASHEMQASSPPGWLKKLFD